jgi:maltose O-acetyltransferase
MLGAASAYHPGVTVGDDAVVGMGAVVIRNVEAGTTVVGNPARLIVKKHLL